MLKEIEDRAWREVKNMLAESCRQEPEDMAGVDKMRERWAEGKSWMFPYFGDEGRVETIITYKPDESDYKNAICSAKNEIYRTMDNRATRGNWSRFSKQEICNLGDAVFNMFLLEELKDNKILRVMRFQGVNDEIVVFKEGTKASKAMRQLILKCDVLNLKTILSVPFDLVKESAEECAELLTTMYSLFQKSFNVEEKCVISINPVDMLLTSAHTTGWQSCHDFHTGGYRAGPISYMLDNCTIIAYAYNDKIPFDMHAEYGERCRYKTEENIPVKKWRQMVYLDRKNESAILSRQYPSVNQIYSKEVRRLTAYLLADCSGAPRKWRYRMISNDYTNGTAVKESRDEENVAAGLDCRCDSNGCHFKDVPSFIIRLENGRSPILKTGVSQFPCAICGEQVITSGSWTCGSCLNRARCAKCGELHRVNDMTYAADDRLYCNRCLETYLSRCDHCEGYAETNGMAHGPNGELYCDGCIDNDYIVYCSTCEHYVPAESAERTIGNYYVCNDCSEESEASEEVEYAIGGGNS